MLVSIGVRTLYVILLCGVTLSWEIEKKFFKLSVNFKGLVSDCFSEKCGLSGSAKICDKPIEEFLSHFHLMFYRVRLINFLSEGCAMALSFAVPGDMFSGHSYAGVFTVKVV